MYVLIWGTIFGCLSVPRIFKSDLEKYTEKYALDYMNNKYGDGDFKITNIKKSYKETLNSAEWVGFDVWMNKKQ